MHAEVSRSLAGIAAGSEAADFLAGILGEDFNVDGLKDRDRLVAASIRLSEIYLVMACQSGWDGIVTEDGKPLEAPEPGSVALLLSDPAIRARVMAVVNSRIHVEQAEGNGLPASPNGGAGAPSYCAQCRASDEPCARGLSVEGERCPEVEFAPRTPEGRAVIDAIGRSGVWKRAGMSGHIVGLDMREALGSMPGGLDMDFARRLLLIAERFFVPAWWAQAETMKEKAD